ARRGQRTKFILKKAGSICSLDATHSLFETARSNACRTISKLAFNRRSWLARFNYPAPGTRCEPGKCFSVEITAHSRYEKPPRQASRRVHPERSEGPPTSFVDHSWKTA